METRIQGCAVANKVQLILLQIFEEFAIAGINYHRRPAHLERASRVKSAMFEPIANAWIVLEDRPSEMKAVQGLTDDWMRVRICLPNAGPRAIWSWEPDDQGFDYLVANANSDLVRDPGDGFDYHSLVLDLGWKNGLPGRQTDPSLALFYAKTNKFVAETVEKARLTSLVPNTAFPEQKNKKKADRPLVRFKQSRRIEALSVVA